MLNNQKRLLQECSVLLVDDSATTRALLGQLLLELGVEFKAVESAAAFRASLPGQSFDLIMLDYRLPDGDGLELLKELREQEHPAAVVLVTGKALVETATEALVGGADGYLDKAYLSAGPEALCCALEKAIVHRRTVLHEREVQGLKEEIQTLIVHDLRSPAACASMALASYQKAPSEEVLELAERSLNRLIHRLDKYMDFTRTNEATWSLKPEDNCLRELAESVVSSLQPLAREKELQLTCSAESAEHPCLFDWDWLFQAVENLVENAVKYTPEGGRVEVLVVSNSEAQELRVNDTGPGIEGARQHRIFQRFYRDPSSAQRVKGTGLGLVTVKRIVEAHQGAVRVDSEGVPGRGACFTVSLPV